MKSTLQWIVRTEGFFHVLVIVVTTKLPPPLFYPSSQDPGPARNALARVLRNKQRA